VNETARRLAALSPEQREMLLARLREQKTLTSEVPRISEEPVDRSAPVPLTDAQEAYWIGGSGLFDLGGSGPNVYVEHQSTTASAWSFADDLSTAMQRMIERHEILRAVILPDGTQRALPQAPPFRVEVRDLSALSPEKAEQRLAEARDHLRYGRFRTDRWPLFQILSLQLGEGRMHLLARFDAVLLDGPTRRLLETELSLVLLQPDRELPPLDISFLDHARALAAFRDSPTWQRSRAYWSERLASLPPLPRLPLAHDVGPATVPRIEKRSLQLLEPEPWRSVRQRAGREGISPTGILTAAFAETLTSWNGGSGLTLGLMGVYRPEDHPRIDRVLGNFNTLHLLAVDGGEAPFVQRAKLLQKRLLADLDHQHYSGHQVLREIRRRRDAGGRALLPVAFDSVVEYAEQGQEASFVPPTGNGPEAAGPAPENSQIDLMISLPQVLLLAVVLEQGDGALELICQATEEVLPAGLVPEMLAAYRSLLARLATDEASWLDPSPVRLPVPDSPEVSPWETLPGDRLLAISPDLARALAGPFAGKVVLQPGPAELANAESLAALAAREKVTTWVSPPAALEAVLDTVERKARGELASLRRVLLHGDRIPVSLPARLAALCPGARLYAGWGTAQTPLAAIGLLGEADFALPAVGRLRVAPLPGCDLRVLDRSRRPLPVWVEGDLHADTGAGLQPTGERARLLPDGRIEIRERRREAFPGSLGYSTDPARVEAALERHPGVGRAVVAWLAGDPEKTAGRGRLAAWIVPRGERCPGAEELRRHLLGILPSHLVPEAFAAVDVGTIGTSDGAALPPIPEPSSPPAAAAWGTLETELAGLWSEVLGERPVSLDADFHALGGDSVRAVRLMARIAERFGLERPLASFLEHPTLSHLTELVDRARAESAERADQADKLARRPFRRLRDSLAALRARLLPPATSPAYGMRIFLTLWFGQFVSAFGTGLGSFALGVWIFEKTGSATSFAMIAFVAAVTMLLLSPLAGSLADRWDRRRLLLLSDLGSGVTTLAMAALLFTGRMQPWHVYPIVILMVGFTAFQGPALLSSVSLLVPRSQLARASGMTQSSRAVAQIIGPLIAGVLVGRIGYSGVILIDCGTFLFAVLTILLVRIPSPPRRQEVRRSTLGDLRHGWEYLRGLPGLVALLSLYAVTNFCMSIVQVLLTPLVLSFATPEDLGSVSSAGAAGVMLGGLTLSLWGGPRRKVLGIFIVLVAQALLLVAGGAQASVPLITLATFAFMFTVPVATACNQAILQSRVATDVQGRVFAVAGMITACSIPVASLIAGPLADRVFGPLLRAGGPLAGTAVSRLVGIGPGRGMGLMFICLGILVLLTVSFAFLNPRLWQLEAEVLAPGEA